MEQKVSINMQDWKRLLLFEKAFTVIFNRRSSPTLRLSSRFRSKTNPLGIILALNNHISCESRTVVNRSSKYYVHDQAESDILNTHTTISASIVFFA